MKFNISKLWGLNRVFSHPKQTELTPKLVFVNAHSIVEDYSCAICNRKLIEAACIEVELNKAMVLLERQRRTIF